MKLTFDYIREHGLLLYEFVRGSHCHGINTPTSDLDTGGVYILPNETRLGLGLDYAPFIEDETHDTVWYELNRYAELLIKSNPTVLESLFVDDEFVLYEHPCFREFRMKRDMFVTKECFNPFGGYAVAQIKKARGLNKMIVQPIVERKTPIDFCYVVYENDTVPVTDWLSMNGFSENDISLAKMNHARDAYAVFVYPGGFCKPNGNDVHVNNLPKGLTSVATLFFNKDAYSKHCNDYKHYKEWETKRNPIRYASNLDKNYDCYLDSETEFLTSCGWKKYDEITQNDLIATFDDTHTIRFEPYISRYSSLYSGLLWTLETSYTRCTVTPNHKLYMSHSFVNKKTEYKYKYLPDENVWEHITVDDFIKNRKGRYFILNHLNNDKLDNLEYDDELLSIIGLFLSEGTVVYKNNGEISYVRISQLTTGKAYDILHNLSGKYKCGEYHYTKRKNRDEVSFDFKNKKLFEIVKQCIVNGKYSYQKNMPLFAYTLSKRQFDVLFNSMMLGDGHFHKSGNMIYYTSSKEMAKGLHTLLSINGYNAQMYGKEKMSYQKKYKSAYENKDGRSVVMYQVFVSKYNKQYMAICKRMRGCDGRNKCGFSSKDVKNERIVCFEMKNGTLITRNNNKIAFHCNSKNMCECMRLMNMCCEIATDGSVNVNRKGIDGDFLLSIKGHNYLYEKLIGIVERKKEEMDDLIAKSTIREKVDCAAVNDIVLNIRGTFFK